MLFLMLSIKLNIPIISAFLFAGVVFYQKFTDIKQKLLPVKQEKDITTQFFKDSILLLSIFPILFNLSSFFIIIFLFLLLGIEFYPMLNSVFAIKVPLFYVNGNLKKTFFSYSFASILIAIMLFLQIPSFLTMLVFLLFFAVNKLYFEK